ncbi:MAG: endopeptidase La [Amoebophilaceae bacterium]|jgi:ATP-dependent Lon protease|nr:endopeptidase La [Amoebophilaceae bacterium]
MHFQVPPSFNNSLLSGLGKESTDEMIQLVVTEEGSQETEKVTPDALPLLPLKQVVLFPGLIIPLTLRRQKLIQLVKKVHQTDGLIGVVAQKHAHVEDPGAKDIFRVGTIAKVLKVIVFPDGNTTIILQGKQRFKVKTILAEVPHLLAQVRPLKTKAFNTQKKEAKALMHSLKEVANNILSLSPEVPPEVRIVLHNIKDPDFLTYFLSANINVDIAKKQHLLEINDSSKRATLLLQYLLKDLEFTQLKRQIQSKVHTDIDQQQRDQYLRHQIRVLQEELGDGDVEELEELRARGKKKKWPEEVATFFKKAIDKAERLSPHNPDYPTLINHAELLLELPWGIFTKDNLDLKQATKILDKDHFGLEKVKERILEYLAVLHLKQDMKGPILCLYGPPGVGKTSLCRSIAQALHRKYVRISLGGLNDEAEIRGHRKTYIGAMPGKIIQHIKKSQASNPVFVLDEIDKISGMRGDPAAALLEVLDPEQNDTFVDNFLEVPYDLSKVLFIATANTLDSVPPALQDRMEVIELNGYTVEEKVEIAKRHLFPKQRRAHGLKASDVGIYDNTMAKLIEDYTRESGVRELERKLGGVLRKVAKAVASKESYPRKLRKSDLAQLLGVAPFDQEIYQHHTLPGVAIGLAWTPVGGEILFIEASLNKGKGKLTLSGQLGDVMKESAITALSYIKAYADTLGIDDRVFDQYDLHVHVPAGAVPKDGPSAGITLLTALASLYTQRKVKDRLAMTGEITLRGKVLPVGGVKEKILAAKRVGIQEIILSSKNRKDIKEINARYTKNLILHYVGHVEEVLQQALQPQKAKNARTWQLVKETTHLLTAQSTYS